MTDRLEAFATKIHDYLADSTVLLVLGKAAGSQNEQLRRIIWNRSQQPCSAKRADRRSGGQRFKADDPEQINREIQGIDRFETAEVKVFAETSERLDQLFDDLLTALDRVTGSTDWDQDGIQYIWTVDESNAQRQPMISAQVRFRSPVAIETKKMVTIKAVINTEQILTS